MAILSGETDLDRSLNVMFSLALLTMNEWSVAVSKVIVQNLENPGKSQLEIAKKMKKSQSTVSEALKRGGFDEVMQMEIYFQEQMERLP
ncbi:MAG: helix-turn-helix domain-containing protein [Saprospiraceae bacterium]|nr:helix-turn-helix domain-containing protein [Saprospiraceae bacterium]